MTEKQIEQLKKILADSTLADSSTELDNAILMSARESAKQPLAEKKAVSDQAMRAQAGFFESLPVSFLRSASLAIVFTVGTFVVMGQLVSVDENIASFDDAVIEENEVLSNEPVYKPNRTIIILPENVALEPAPSRLSRDQILMNFELSDTEELLAKLSLKFEPSTKPNNDGLFGTAVQIAMLDIDSMIQTGELDDARQRYSDLKTDCDDCGLPDTLEALVIASQEFAAKADSPKTG